MNEPTTEWTNAWNELGLKNEPMYTVMDGRANGSTNECRDERTYQITSPMDDHCDVIRCRLCTEQRCEFLDVGAFWRVFLVIILWYSCRFSWRMRSSITVSCSTSSSSRFVSTEWLLSWNVDPRSRPYRQTDKQCKMRAKTPACSSVAVAHVLVCTWINCIWTQIGHTLRSPCRCLSTVFCCAR